MLRPLATVFITLLVALPLCLSGDLKQKVLCDRRTLPPKTPSFQACSLFLERLANLARKEPKGAYKWYGRHIDECSECTKLPAYVFFSGMSCATVIDVFDKDENSLSLFGMDDLERSLSAMVGKCWLGDGVYANRHNGIGYPGSQNAWAGLVKAPGHGAIEGYVKMDLDNMTMVDLSKGWIEKVGGSGHDGALA